MPRKVGGALLPCLAAFALALLLGGRALALSAGDRFPELTLPDAETGVQVEVAKKLSGRVGAIVFMQTTCSVCKKELDALKRIAQANEGFTVIAVSVDAGEAGRVIRFKKERELPFTFLHDPEFTKPQEFGFRFTPGLVITGKDGIITLLKSGYRPEDGETIERQIGELTTR